MSSLPDEAQVWLLAVSAAAFIVWGIHLVLAVRAWLRERSARTFQSAYIALMISTGMTSIVLGRSTRVWPDVEWITRLSLLVAPVLVWLLLSGGVVALWTWRRPLRRW